METCTNELNLLGAELPVDHLPLALTTRFRHTSLLRALVGPLWHQATIDEGHLRIVSVLRVVNVIPAEQISAVLIKL